jgi:predicted ATPase
MGDQSGARSSPIRTPDQRLRVFVSSTLRELEPERRAVRSAIERLRLAPVMFELGARPHPPRELYRAYLEQSDVFVGIYAESYGWVAPDEEVSGLEDEYNLAPRGMPKLIYIKESEHRDERLRLLIDRIRSDDTAAYLSFRDAGELGDQVAGDLATLLAERFDQSRAAPATPAVAEMPASHVPVPLTRIIGRERAIEDIVALLADRSHRLVTLFGPGGIGKSRLSIAAAEAAAPLFPDGVVFVPLENVLEPELLLSTIGYALGIRETTGLQLEERLALALANRRMLFVLDNFEQIVRAAPMIVQLYSLAPDAAFLVTSRVVLRVRGEQVYDVEPLATDDPDSPDSLSRARSAPAVELFVERASAANPMFALTDANLAAVVGICRVLDGVPLAIELAAARARLLTPADILSRLDRQLALLVDSSRDLPERQRTLRSTIEWSAGLLDGDSRRLLTELAVFAPGFTLDSVDALGARRDWGFDVYTALESLIDSSLVDQADVDGEPSFSLLVSVREYGVELLAAAGEEEAVRDAHAAVYTAVARAQADDLGTDRQLAAVARLRLERGNLRAAVRHMVTLADAETACEVAWRLFVFWWVGGYLMEVAVWLEEMLERADGAASERVRAIVGFYTGWRDAWTTHRPGIAATLLEAAREFEREGDLLGVAMATTTAGVAEINSAAPDVAAATGWLHAGAEAFRAAGSGWGECLAYVAIGRIALLQGRYDEATEMFHRGAEASRASGEVFAGTVALHHVGRMYLLAGRLEESADSYLQSLVGSVALRHEEGIAYCLEGMSAVAARRGDARCAGVLAGAAESIRRRTAAIDPPAFVYHVRFLDELRSTDAATELAAGEAEGRELGPFEAARFATETVAAWKRSTARA